MIARLRAAARDGLLPAAARRAPRPAGPRADVILVVQPDHLGDILLAQPAVQVLRERHPDHRLVAVVGPWSREIARRAWPVDDIAEVVFPGFERAARGSLLGPYRQLRHDARRLAALRAETAYILRPDAWWSAWLAALVAPDVIAGDDSRVATFADRTVSVPGDGHAVVRAWSIAAAGLPGQAPPDPLQTRLTLPTDAAASHTAAELLASRGVSGAYVVIHPGAGAAVKEWPPHRWRRVSRALRERGLCVVVTGTAGEEPAAASIVADIAGAVTVAGATPLPVLIELLRGATLVLGPDAGPLHLAVATGTPTLHLFGPSDPRRYGPWGDPARHRVLSAGWTCPRCGDLSPARAAGCGCMLALAPEDVILGVQALLDDHARR